ncbi:MAG: zinc-ribbon domain containing protein [Stenotrophomonas maltophilia]
MALTDKTLVCADCGGEFIFTAGEQEFFNSRGFVNEPKRCQPCRSSRRNQERGGWGDGPREMHPITCAQCGADAMVPFRPRGDRPVYCSDCFSQNRNTSTQY